jgi:hypothetical protein
MPMQEDPRTARIAAWLRRGFTFAASKPRASYWLFVATAMAVGVALRAPAVKGTHLADDWDHYAMSAGVYPVHRGPFDYYDFVRNDARERHALLASGRFPWWTSPNIHLGVLRPVASALIHFDFRFLDGAHHPNRMHWHSMLWWLVLVAGVAAALPMALPRGVAALAVCLYALDNAHTLPVAWSANRSELIAVAFITWALWAHLSLRTRGFRAGLWLSPLLVALGLLSGEHALGPLAYIGALELLGSEGTLRRRVAALVPFALLTLAYFAVRAALGYGVAGSSFYVDPMGEPLRYLKACAERLPLLLGDVMFGYPAEWKYWGTPFRTTILHHHLLPDSWLTLEHLALMQQLLGLVAAGLLFVVLRVLWRRRATSHVPGDPTEPPQSLHWLLWGGFLALVPTCGTLPMSRLTVAAAIGFDAALAWVLWSLLASQRRRLGLLRRVAALLLAALIVAIHGVHSASHAREDSSSYALRSHLEEAWVLGADVPGEHVGDLNVFLVAARDWASQFAFPFVRHLHGLPKAASVELLTAASDSPHELVRVAPNVLEVFLPRHLLGSRFLTSVYRHEDLPFKTGDRLSCARFDVEIVEAFGGEPTHLRFSFPDSLDDRRYVFLYPAVSGIIRLTMPPVGGRFRLPPPAWPFFGL